MPCDADVPKSRLPTSPRNGPEAHRRGARIEKQCWKLLRKLAGNLIKTNKNNYLQFLARLLRIQRRPRP